MSGVTPYSVLVSYAEEKRAEAASQQERVEVSERLCVLLSIGAGVCCAVSGEREHVTGSEGGRSDRH